MRKRGYDPSVLEVDESGDQAAFPMPDGLWNRVKREHLYAGDGTMAEMAAVVLDVYLEDLASAR
jgi:hypothetical protein